MICLIVFVARHPRYCDFSSRAYNRRLSVSNLIGLSPPPGTPRTAHFATEVSLSPPFVIAFRKVLPLVQVLEEQFVQSACVACIFATSVTYLLYRYSVFNERRGVVAPHLYEKNKRFEGVFSEKNEKFFKNQIIFYIPFSYEVFLPFVQQKKYFPKRFFDWNLPIRQYHEWTFLRHDISNNVLVVLVSAN